MTDLKQYESIEMPQIGDYIALSTADVNKDDSDSDIKIIYKIIKAKLWTDYVMFELQYIYNISSYYVNKIPHYFWLQIQNDELYKFMSAKTKEELEMKLDAKKYNI